MTASERRSVLTLPGIGPVSAGWLQEIDIETVAELRAIGAVAAWRRLRHWDEKRVNKTMLWVLHGALSGIPWTEIDYETKAELWRQANQPTKETR